MELALTIPTEEILGQHKSWKFDREDKNGTRYFYDYACDRCGGTGKIYAYRYIDSGTCFKCGGSGHKTSGSLVKVYTPDHYEELKAKREQREADKIAQKRDNFKKNLPVILRNMGFGVEGEELVIYRPYEDTWAYKDQLKEAGYKYNKTVGWFGEKPLDGWNMQRMTSEQVVNIYYESCNVTWKEPDEVKPLLMENKLANAENVSTWQGNIGDKIEIDLHIDKKIVGEGFRGGVSYLYLMHDAFNNKFTWSSACEYEANSDVRFKATIKDHVVYHDKRGFDVQQTVLTRCTKARG